MHIIPVIDVRHGLAVRAVAGARANYRPLETPFAPSSDPVAVARGLRSLFPFDTLYVADLDGIEGRGRDARLAARLADAVPDVNLWIDDGRVTAEAARPPFAKGNVTVVTGSEAVKRAAFHGTGVEASPPPSLPRKGGGTLSREPLVVSPLDEGENPIPSRDRVPPPLRRRLGGGEAQPLNQKAPPITRKTSRAGSDPSWRSGGAPEVLSLDFRGDTFVGPPELLAHTDLWPTRVIVMTLARVGTNAGPDLARIAGIAARAGPTRRVYAAGGVRDIKDLIAARKAGAAGALIATALHAGTIKAGDLEEAAGL